jgi:hypothetical protein
MTTVLRKLTVTLLMFNFAIAFLGGATITDGWNQNPSTGIQQEVTQTNDAAKEVQSERTSLSDSFSGGMIASVGKITGLDDTIFALPVLLANMGVPGWIIDFATGPMYLMVALDIIGLIRGMVIN